MGVHYNKADFITYGKPSLFLDFANKKSLTDRISGNNLITFTRSSIGTYVGADGLIKTAAADDPRFDHDPTTGESLGLLIEEKRTNLVATSVPSGYSTFNRATQTTGVTAPDGSTDARNYNNTGDPSGGGIDYIFTNFSTSFTTGTQYVISIFSTYSEMDITQGGLASGKWTSVNSTQHISYPNGWYRHWRLYEATVDNPNITPQIVISTSATAQSNQSLWGMQVEANSFPTSYIPTSGSTVTRNADLAYISQANMQSWYNNTEGTIFSHSIGYRGVGGIAYFGSNSEGWGLFQNASFLTNKGRGSYTPDTANTSGVLSNTFRNIKAAISINDTTNLTSYYVNGSAIGNDKTRSGPFTYPIGFGLAQADVGGTSQVTHSLCLNKIVYYPTTLTNSQLQSRTE